MEFTTGDLLKADVDALVNTVNCDGYMGRGIAAQFKRRYPDNFRAYAAACKRNEVEPGKMLVFETGALLPPRWLINFPTKRHWRGKSRIQDIESGLVALAQEVQARGVTSIAIPPLGCGLGGLDWRDVRPLIERTLAGLAGVRVVVFEPTEAAAPLPTLRGDAPRLTPGRAALVSLCERYLSGLMDPSVSLLEVHKLLYFLQSAGEPLRLRYTEGHYGPYAENLRHVLAVVEGHLLQGYGDGGDAPDKPLELLPGAAEQARAFLSGQPATLERFERVSSLVDGFESPFGMELLATVHWVMTIKHGRGEGIVKAVHDWSPRKRRFTPRQIQLVAQRLQEQGWAEGASA